MLLRTKGEQRAYIEGYTMCANNLKKYLTPKGKQIFEGYLVPIKNAVENNDNETKGMKLQDFFTNYLDTQGLEDRIVRIRYKYSKEDKWTYTNVMLEVDLDYEGNYVWANTWDGDPNYIEVVGCIPVRCIYVQPFDIL